jgi:hypothetical protein
MYARVRLFIAAIIIMFFAGISPANIGENSLNIYLKKYDPYPVIL